MSDHAGIRSSEYNAVADPLSFDLSSPVPSAQAEERPARPHTAMILAAGLGTRMRPITDTRPKPLVEVARRSLLDRALDAARAGGLSKAVVNVHHLADQIESHLGPVREPKVTISDERARLLDSGGGVKRALPALGSEPFVVLNADTFWVEAAAPAGMPGPSAPSGAGSVPTPALRRMARLHRPGDVLLLLASREDAVGFAGAGDFFIDRERRLARRGAAASAPFVYAGAMIVEPGAFDDTPDEPFSLNLIFDRAIAQGRLKGFVLDGLWLHVGTPEAIGEAEQALDRFVREAR